MKIGFFDSGLGGLTVLKAVAEELPQYDYYFFGDTKNLPYGDKTEEEVCLYTESAMRKMFEENCLLIVIACNTASAETLRKLQDGFLQNEYPNRKILGVIIPTIEEMLASDAERALLIATKRTVESGKYERELKLKGSRPIILNKVAVPELVGYIEAGEIEKAAAKTIEVIDTQTEAGDVIVLGCTHYSLLKITLRDHYGDRYTFVSQDEVVPIRLKDYLQRHPEIEGKLSKNTSRKIYLTKPRSEYETFAKTLK